MKIPRVAKDLVFNKKDMISNENERNGQQDGWKSFIKFFFLFWKMKSQILMIFTIIRK